MRASGVLNTSKSPKPFVASQPLFTTLSHLYCYQGTPGFIARAVELGRPVSPGNDMLYIPEVPRSAECYGTCHPDRVKKFPHSPHKLSPISMDGTDRQWRHELHHDAESVFWVLLYWIVVAQPENEEKEPIATHIWTGLTGPVTSRIHLLRGGLHGATHSVYRPLWPMLNKLAHILNADGHWVESSDPRTDPGYINEAFQRLILQFILEHRNEPFMQHRVESQPRRPEEMSQFLSRSSDFSRKRSLSESTIPSGTKRLHMVEVGWCRCVYCDCFYSGFSGLSGKRRK